jgi:hypothetical protein
MNSDIKIIPVKTKSHLQFVFKWEGTNARLYLKDYGHKEIALMVLYYSYRVENKSNMFNIKTARSFWNALIKKQFKRLD